MTHRVILQDAFKTFTLDQDKVLAPEETVRRFRDRLKQVDLDILAATERIDTGRLSLYPRPVDFTQAVERVLADDGGRATRSGLLEELRQLVPLTAGFQDGQDVLVGEVRQRPGAVVGVDGITSASMWAYVPNSCAWKWCWASTAAA